MERDSGRQVATLTWLWIGLRGVLMGAQVKYKPPQSLPCLGPVEELNYSKISIK